MNIEALKLSAGAYKGSRQAILMGQVIEEIEKHSVITRAKVISINCKNYDIEDRTKMHGGVATMADNVIRILINLDYIYKKEPGLYVKCD